MRCIYIGRRFYNKSRTILSSIYTKDKKRTDWGFIQNALENGETIIIEPATIEEIAYFENELNNIEKELNYDKK